MLIQKMAYLKTAQLITTKMLYKSIVYDIGVVFSRGTNPVNRQCFFD